MIIGIDPGLTGAVAILEGQSLRVQDIPTAPGPKGRSVLLHRVLFDLLDLPPAAAFVELVSARPGQGVTSMFRFGETLGAIHMALAARGHALHQVTPAVWKRHFGITKDKGSSRALAAQRWPDAAAQFARVKDDGRAEAALIAQYGADALSGRLPKSPRDRTLARLARLAE